MKKIFLLLITIIFIVSCTEETDFSNSMETSNRNVVISLAFPCYRMHSNTRASVDFSNDSIHLSLEANDSVGFIKAVNGNVNNCLTGDNISFDLSYNLSNQNPNTQCKLYYPYRSDYLSVGHFIPLSMSGQSQYENNDYNHILRYSVFCSDPFTSSQLNCNNVSAVITPRTAIIKINATLRADSTINRISLVNIDGQSKFIERAEFHPEYHGSGDFIPRQYSDRLTLDVTQVISNYQSQGDSINCTFYMSVIPVESTGPMYISAECEDGRKYISPLINNMQIEQGCCYELTCDCRSENKEFVDLWLPSGTLWAKDNVNALPYNRYYGTTCTYQHVNSVLASYGSAWSIPSKAQWEELFTYCDCEVTSWYMGSPNKCHKLTSRYNGRSIYLTISKFDSESVYGGYWYYDNDGLKFMERHYYSCFNYYCPYTAVSMDAYLDYQIRPVLTNSYNCRDYH